jgi:hypothetical protein
MNDLLFSVASLCAIAGWLALGLAVVTPPGRARVSLLGLGGRVIPVGLCLLYAAVLAAHWGKAPGGGFASLAEVQSLFAVPGKMLAGWVHFLAFDLLVGHGIVAHALAHGRARWPLLIILPAAFLFGPLGILSYVLARSAGSVRQHAPPAL